MFTFSGLTFNQLNNNLTSQAATMQTHGLPNDILSNLDPIVLIIFIPVCDLVVSLPLVFLFFLNNLRYLALVLSFSASYGIEFQRAEEDHFRLFYRIGCYDMGC